MASSRKQRIPESVPWRRSPSLRGIGKFDYLKYDVRGMWLCKVEPSGSRWIAEIRGDETVRVFDKLSDAKAWCASIV